MIVSLAIPVATGDGLTYRAAVPAILTGSDINSQSPDAVNLPYTDRMTTTMKDLYAASRVASDIRGARGYFYDVDVTSLDEALEYVQDNLPTASFISSQIHYPRVEGGTVPDTTTLAEYLVEDAATLSGAQDATLDGSIFMFEGMFVIPEPGTYTIQAFTDESPNWLGIQTDSNNGIYVESQQITFDTAGFAPFRLIYFEHTGSTGIHLRSTLTGVDAIVPSASLRQQQGIVYEVPSTFDRVSPLAPLQPGETYGFQALDDGDEYHDNIRLPGATLTSIEDPNATAITRHQFRIPGNDPISGLDDAQTYYLIVDPSVPGRISFARTAEDAKAGLAIDLDPKPALQANGAAFDFIAVDATANTVTLADPAAELLFDFGTAGSPLMPGATRVTASTSYSQLTGYGWSAGTVKEDDDARGDELIRDNNYGEDITFVVDLPNGTYDVTLKLGQTGPWAHDDVGVFLQGKQLDTVNSAEYQVVTKLYSNITVTGRQLTLRLADLGGSWGNANIGSMQIHRTDGPAPLAMGTAVTYRAAADQHIEGLVDGTTYYAITDPSQPQPMLFDFGSDTSPVAPGAIRVSPSTNTATYGWISSSAVSSQVRQTGDELNLDNVLVAPSNAGGGKFFVKLPDGTYNIQVGIGDTGGGNGQNVRLELNDTLDTFNLLHERVTTHVYPSFVVQGGQLLLTLQGDAGVQLPIASLRIDPVNPIKLATSAANASHGTAVDLDTQPVMIKSDGTKLPFTFTDAYDTLHFESDPGVATGDGLTYQAAFGTRLVGLDDGETYYAIAFDSSNPTRLRLSATAEGARTSQWIKLPTWDYCTNMLKFHLGTTDVQGTHFVGIEGVGITAPELPSGTGGQVNVSSLATGEGLTLSSALSQATALGYGDINADGYDDLFIGLADASPSGRTQAGRVYVVYGRNDLSNNLNLDNLKPSDGFYIDGLSSGDRLGASLAADVDLNDDGLRDVTIGAPGVNSGTGAVYAIFGSSNFHPSQFSPVEFYRPNSVSSSTQATDLYAVGNLIQGPGVGFDANSPYSKLAGGNKGDWVTDTCGSPCDYIQTKGQPKLVFDLGRDLVIDGISVWGYDSTNANGVSRFSLAFATAAEGPNGFGKSVSYQPQYSLTNDDKSRQAFAFSGTVSARYVQFTALDNFFSNAGTPPGGDRVGLGEVAFSVLTEVDGPVSFDLATLNGTNGMTISAQPGEALGQSVASIHDVNADGIDDVVLGAPGASQGQGGLYVVFGSGQPAKSINVTGLDGTNGFFIENTTVTTDSQSSRQFGSVVQDVGDINADGFGDILLGSPDEDRAFVIFGSNDNFNTTIDVSDLDGGNGFALVGQTDTNTGWSVSGTGDINGDGMDDLVVSAPLADPAGKADAGRVYVVYGRATSFPSSLELDQISSADGYFVDGLAAGNRLGDAVTQVGDFNGDGLDDLLIGAPAANSGAGAAFVVYGSREERSTVDLSALNGTNGFVIQGAAAGGGLGSLVSAAGDVQGDDAPDLLVGAPASNKSYLLFGNDPEAPQYLVHDLTASGASGKQQFVPVSTDLSEVTFTDTTPQVIATGSNGNLIGGEGTNAFAHIHPQVSAGVGTVQDTGSSHASVTAKDISIQSISNVNITANSNTALRSAFDGYGNASAKVDVGNTNEAYVGNFAQLNAQHGTFTLAAQSDETTSGTATIGSVGLLGDVVIAAPTVQSSPKTTATVRGNANVGAATINIASDGQVQMSSDANGKAGGFVAVPSPTAKAYVTDGTNAATTTTVIESGATLTADNISITSAFHPQSVTASAFGSSIGVGSGQKAVADAEVNATATVQLGQNAVLAFSDPPTISATYEFGELDATATSKTIGLISVAKSDAEAQLDGGPRIVNQGARKGDGTNLLASDINQGQSGAKITGSQSFVAKATSKSYALWNAWSLIHFSDNGKVEGSNNLNTADAFKTTALMTAAPINEGEEGVHRLSVAGPGVHEGFTIESINWGDGSPPDLTPRTFAAGTDSIELRRTYLDNPRNADTFAHTISGRTASGGVFEWTGEIHVSNLPPVIAELSANTSRSWQRTRRSRRDVVRQLFRSWR